MKTHVHKYIETKQEKLIRKNEERTKEKEQVYLN